MFDQLFEDLKKAQLLPLLNRSVIGVEKESHRIKTDGSLSKYEHPKALGNRANHPYISTDFAESQVEFVSDSFNDKQAVIDQLQALHASLLQVLDDEELLWPLSMPPKLPENTDEIKISQISPDAIKYRQYLTQKYGKRLQMVSGIHINFSLDPVLLVRLYDELYHFQYTDIKQLQTDLYLKLAQNFQLFRYVLTYLMGASPIANANFNPDIPEHPVRSLRASRQFGYYNESSLKIDFTNAQTYANSINQAVQENTLESAREYYGTVRLRGNETLNSQNASVDYLEFRSFDLNPYHNIGISLEELDFVHIFLMYLLVMPKSYQGDINQAIALAAQINDEVALENPLAASKYAQQIQTFLTNLLDFATQSGVSKNYIDAICKMQKRIENHHETLSYRIYQDSLTDSFKTFGLQLAQVYKKQVMQVPYQLPGYTDMETSTQMLMMDAFTKGLKVNILDRRDQFIELIYQGHKEWVKDGNITSLDRLISWPLVDNKVVTKTILANQGFKVPAGAQFDKLEDAIIAYKVGFGQRAIVVKPQSSNVGKGITVFLTRPEQQDFETAFLLAQAYDTNVMVEEFIAGSEYRFLVIDNKVEAVLERIPANVVGDGQSTIRQLVNKKNQEPMRGQKHLAPLQKIGLTDREALILKQQGYTFDDVIPRGTQVFLLTNSNISSGGDSIDVTDEIDHSYFEIAQKVAQTLQLKISGIDIIIPNLYQKYDANHPEMAVILEANYNPAMFMHLFPWAGQKRRVTMSVLKALFKELD